MWGKVAIDERAIWCKSMLMVDALETGAIRSADVPLIRLLAGLLADALA